MGKLEELIEQRKELDRQIKALKCPSYESDSGTARCFVRTRHGEPLDNWAVTLKTINLRGGAEQAKEIIVGNTKEECIDALKGVVYTLNDLLERLERSDADD